MTGIDFIHDERHRQVEKEGWTFDHDDQYVHNELEDAGDCYLYYSKCGAHSPKPKEWPWEPEWWKPTDSVKRNSEKAGALYIAELERIRRKGVASSAHIDRIIDRIAECSSKIDSYLASL